MEVLELEAFVERHGSYQENHDAERKWEGRSEVVLHGSRERLIHFLKVRKGIFLSARY